LNDGLRRLLLERDRLIQEIETNSIAWKEEAKTNLAQMHTAAQIAQQANRIRDLAELLSQAVNLIAEGFGFYHVAIFLNDRSNAYTLLQAANSEGGQRMLARGHKLKIGDSGSPGIVGNVASQGESKIVLDFGQNADAEHPAVPFNNPDLPLTRSEMAMPLQISGKTFGVLDIQSTKPQAFGEDDITIIQIIADNLATAFENARLFTTVQSNLDEIQALHRQYLARTWPEMSAAQKQIECTWKRSDPSAEIRKLSVPIKLRDQVIGAIEIEAESRSEMGRDTGEWTAEELALIEAVSTQAALALENARLVEETQYQAEQERITANVSSKVWAFSDIDTILRTALLELGNSLGATEGFIKLWSESPAEGGE
jgi:GAF domain-containing protein